jgi:hypothetical protein
MNPMNEDDIMVETPPLREPVPILREGGGSRLFLCDRRQKKQFTGHRIHSGHLDTIFQKAQRNWGKARVSISAF